MKIGIGIGTFPSAVATSVSIPPLDGTSPTAAYSVSRNLLSTFSGEYYTLTTDRVSGLTDQSGNTRNLAQATATARPVIGTNEGVVAIDFDGQSRYLAGPNISEFIAADSGYMVVSFLARTATISASAGDNGHRVISDAAEGGNIVINSGPQIRAIQFDGAYKQTPQQLIAFDTPIVAAFRKDATKLYLQVNKLDEVEIAAGNLTALNYAFYLSDPTTNDLDGMIFEVATFQTVPDEGKSAIVDSFMRQCGSPFPPSIASYPTASNTGISGTLTETSGFLSITTDGTILENVHHTGNIEIDANNVTIRNCRVTSDSFTGVQVVNGRTGAVIEDCEIHGVDGPNNLTAIKGSGAFRRNNIYAAENAFVIEGADGCIVEDNYVHSLSSGAAEPHYDCIELNGGQVDVTIRGNTLLCEYGQTSAININNYFGAVDGVLVEDNYMAGGGYTLYVVSNFTAEPVANVTITNNILGSGQFGYLNLDVTPTMSGNIAVETGFPV